MLSRRAQKAVEVLKSGGEFRYGLEANYFGREQFQARLRKKGANVRGFGFAVFNELMQAGLLMQYGLSSSVASYYRLKAGA